MILTEIDKSLLIKDFPYIEPFYETIVHKKVYNSDFILAIPYGQKCFVWFTTFKNQNVCVILEINENNTKINKIYIINSCFHNKLSYGNNGTILYGTLFKCHKNNITYFSSEDIYFYKGENIINITFFEKLNIFENIYSNELKNVLYFNNNIIFGLPIINNSYEKIIEYIENLPYKIKYIQFRKNNKIDNLKYIKYETKYEKPPLLLIPVLTIPKTNITIPQTNITIPVLTIPQTNIQKPKNIIFRKEIIFKIKPDIQNDIYNLYYSNQGVDYLYDNAYIPDYKTSVIMNKLFRNIKENNNLDALEESDDEDEFENTNIDKFVYLNREFNMVCIWNNRFKKWTPISVASDNAKIVTKCELFNNKLII